METFQPVAMQSCYIYPSIIVEEGLQILEQIMDEDNTLHEKTDLTKQEIKQLVRLRKTKQIRVLSTVAEGSIAQIIFGRRG